MSSTSSAAAAATTSAAAVPHQAGILEGANPSKYNASDPIVLFIIQALIIILTCRLFYWPLSKLRQPRVIAEVIGGIVLGPTVMGRIPGFSEAIFPKEGMPVLSMAANLGLILFLFIVGLETDLRIMVQNWRIALSVGAAGMAIPFGLGCAVAYGLYHDFRIVDGVESNESISFGVYLLFIGVAMAITAFPVLARILTELQLLQTNVGTIVLSAGVGNDVVGWILLALTVALVNAGSGISALYVLLVSVGYVLFLVYVVRPAFHWALAKTNSIEGEPSEGMIALTIVMVLASAFFTNIIGVHAIFGGFLVGLICPHQGGFATKMMEKVEDLVSVLLLPLYFALSGLRTNIGLLDSGLVWGYVVAVIAVAMFGKISGGTMAARLSGMYWRESTAIGVLMSCKGLVELIVLNIGLTAGILSDRVFTIFVVMALVTTFSTTPLVYWIYPQSYQKKVELYEKGEIEWDGTPRHNEDGSISADTVQREKLRSRKVSKVTVLLRLENMPSIFSFLNLLGDTGDRDTRKPKVHRSKEAEGITEEGESAAPFSRPVEVHGVRLVELSNRNSAVMQVAELEETQERDPVVNLFRTVAPFHNIAASAGLSIAPEEAYADVLSEAAADQSSDLLLVPWSETGAITEMAEGQTILGMETRFVSSTHNAFVSKVLASTTCSIGILVNRSHGPSANALSRTLSASRHSIKSVPHVKPVADPSHHIFFPYFGGVDDQFALRFVLQMANNSNVTATIMHVIYSSDAKQDQSSIILQQTSTRSDLPKTMSESNFPQLEGEQQGASSSNPALSATSSADDDTHFFQTLADSLPSKLTRRVVFSSHKTARPLQFLLSEAKKEVGMAPKNGGDLVVLGRGAHESRPFIRSELVTVLNTTGRPGGAGAETRKCLGDVAEGVIVTGVSASLLVLQAGGKMIDSDDEIYTPSS